MNLKVKFVVIAVIEKQTINREINEPKRKIHLNFKLYII